MGILIGIDEAGLGPNFGPYVVTATAWETPGAPARTDLWRLFSRVITQTPQTGDDRLHIADSKAVFQPAKGLAALERGVLCALGLLPLGDALTDRRLRRSLCGDDGIAAEPWYDGDDLTLPVAASFDDLCAMTERWKGALGKSGLHLVAVQSAILEPRQFNALIDRHQNKAEALSLTSLRLLRRVAEFAQAAIGRRKTEGRMVELEKSTISSLLPPSDVPLPPSNAAVRPSDTLQKTLVWCDKHGGRNRYDVLMSQCFDGELAFRIKESAELSVYRLGNMEIRFLPRAEVQFPVALASMISKYLREIAMLRFNRFWGARIRDLKPTQGYPSDSHRFREAIAEEQQRLGVDDAILWRCR